LSLLLRRAIRLHQSSLGDLGFARNVDSAQLAHRNTRNTT
jgi:hypothetical protein